MYRGAHNLRTPDPVAELAFDNRVGRFQKKILTTNLTCERSN